MTFTNAPQPVLRILFLAGKKQQQIFFKAETKKFVKIILSK